MDIFMLVKLFGGLALFLYGMHVLSNGLEKLSGGRLEQILERFTNNIFKGVALGALVTAAIQSSSATTVIVVGLVNAKILKLRQAIGIIMGANIGTTITAHILRLTQMETSNLFLQILKPTALAPLMATVGIILFMVAKKSFRRDLGQMLVGFGILFSGMFQMEAAVLPLRDLPEFYDLFARMQNPLLGVLVGAVVTGVIQSSAASIGILQALSATGAITFSAAFPIIMGQNIGTCVTPIMASIGASRNAKRSAAIHLSFNILGTVIFLIATYAIQYAVGFSFWNDPISSGGIANFHTVFNIVVTLLFIPFAGLLEKLVCTLFKPTEAEQKADNELAQLDPLLLLSPGLALEHAQSAAVDMAALARENLQLASSLFRKFDPKVIERVMENETTIDRMEDRIENYLLEICKHELSEAESELSGELLHLIGEFEHIGDGAENLAQRAEQLHQSGTVFSEQAQQELDLILEAVFEIVDLAVSGYEQPETPLAYGIEPLEEIIDRMEEALKSTHIQRLRDGLCTVDAAFPFVESIAAMEKISDYCSNIGVVLVAQQEHKRNNITLDSHDYLHMLHKGETEGYAELYREYEKKYYLPLRSLIRG